MDWPSFTRFGYSHSVRPFTEFGFSQLCCAHSLSNSIFSATISLRLTPHRPSTMRFDSLRSPYEPPVDRPCPLRYHSPGNGTLLRCTTTVFSSTGIPLVFGVLFHLDAPCRPSIQFLFISSQLSHITFLPPSNHSPGLGFR